MEWSHVLGGGIGKELPSLRRFARALSGSQSSGDSYVASMLRVVIADPDIISPAHDLKLALYRLLLTMWEAVGLNTSSSPASEISATPADLNLQDISPRPRQAFLLTALEGLSVQQAARVMLVSEEKCHALIDAAASEIGEQMACDVLIIEDEPLIALDVSDIARSMGHTVRHVARTHTEAIAAAAVHRPDLVLADIQLADGSSGLDAVREILQSIDIPVIFITAYPERLLTGERPEPTYLIEKPFKAEEVRALIAQALFLSRKMARN